MVAYRENFSCFAFLLGYAMICDDIRMAFAFRVLRQFRVSRNELRKWSHIAKTFHVLPSFCDMRRFAMICEWPSHFCVLRKFRVSRNELRKWSQIAKTFHVLPSFRDMRRFTMICEWPSRFAFCDNFAFREMSFANGRVSQMGK
jgi:ribosomal protein S14